VVIDIGDYERRDVEWKENWEGGVKGGAKRKCPQTIPPWEGYSTMGEASDREK